MHQFQKCLKSFLAQHNCGYYDETILITYLFHESIKFRSHRVTYTNTMTRSDNHKNEMSINDNNIDIDESIIRRLPTVTTS